jgi:hypothetical protein
MKAARSYLGLTALLPKREIQTRDTGQKLVERFQQQQSQLETFASGYLPISGVVRRLLKIAWPVWAGQAKMAAKNSQQYWKKL